MSEQIHRQILSGEKAPQSGYYVYVRHVEESHGDCGVPAKAKQGLYLSKGAITPDLMTCSHKVVWELVG